MKSFKIHFALKKGSFNKFLPQLRYIKRTYRPDYLKISQEKYYDHFDAKPMPVIEFIVDAFDAVHFMDDFIDRFPKLVVTGGSEPFHWTKIPKKANLRSLREYLIKRKIIKKKIAILMKKRYKDRKKKK